MFEYRPSLKHPELLTFLVVLSHRLFVLISSVEFIRELNDSNPAWFTVAVPSANALQDHLILSILYLQQSPPIPNILIGIFVKLLDGHWEWCSNLYPVPAASCPLSLLA